MRVTHTALTFEYRGPSNVKASKKVVTAVAVESADDASSDSDPGSEKLGMSEANSSVNPSSSEVEESEPVSDKKAGPRKPSKKALETAMHEVGATNDHHHTRNQAYRTQQPFFPADKQPPKNTSEGQGVRPTPAIKVKMEKVDDGSADKDEDNDNDGGRSAGREGSARVAERIYKKALKILKRKLYFENFFPTDAEKDSLPYSCWTSAVAAMDQIDGGTVAAHNMLYEFKYDDVVRTFTGGSICFLISHPSNSDSA